MYDKPLDKRQDMTSLYIAGPYTIGVPDDNLRQAIDAANTLRPYGWKPFIPHLNFLWGLRHDHDVEYWMEWCLDWLAECDALYRLPGESEGGDIEVEKAKEWGISVFHDIEHLKVGEPDEQQ